MPDDKAKVPAFLEAVDPEDEIGAGFESSAIVQQRCFDRLGELVSWSESCAEKTKTVFWFEPRLFLARAEEAYAARLGTDLLQGGKRYRRRPRQGRLLGTFLAR